MNRREFIEASSLIGLALLTPSSPRAHSRPDATNFDRLRTARAFRIDGYQYPLAPQITYNPEQVADALEEMRIDTVRIATMGKYSYIQGIPFTNHPDLGERDILEETITACKPRGMRVIPYISTGNRLAASMLTEDYPQYAQKKSPGGGPEIMDVRGEDRANVCWNTEYREAYLAYIDRVIEGYDVDGLYFDAWMLAWYHYDRPYTCYCFGCRNGFLRASGKQIPYHPKLDQYTPDERRTVRQYLTWKHEEMIDVFQQVRAKADDAGLPLVTNVNNPWRLEREDPRIRSEIDGYLYEGIPHILERTEAVTVAADLEYPIWPYVRPGEGRARQEIFANAMYGGGTIITRQDLLRESAERNHVAEPHTFLEEHESYYADFSSVPYAAVVYGFEREKYYGTIAGAFRDHAVNDPVHKGHQLRDSTHGAFQACSHRQIQTSSIVRSQLEAEASLSPYQVLVLADQAHLRKQQLEAIRAYVANGGGLVVTCSTSLYNANNQKNDRFDLEDLLGVQPDPDVTLPGPPASSNQAYLSPPHGARFTASKKTNSGLESRRLSSVTVDDFVPVQTLEDATVDAELHILDSDRTVPGIVTQRYGRGTVIYIAAPLGLAYRNGADPAVATLLTRCVEQAAGTPPPYRVEAPSDVLANMTMRENIRILHLLNTTQPSYWSRGQPANEVAKAYGVSPVRNLSVTVPTPKGSRVKRVQPLRKPSVDWAENNKGLRLQIPELPVYQAVVIEYGP